VTGAWLARGSFLLARLARGSFLLARLGRDCAWLVFYWRVWRVK